MSRSEEAKKRQKEAIRRWQKANPEKVAAAKKRYYSTEKGKAQKRKEDAAFIASGKRAVVEARRSSKPLSEARLQSRKRYELMRRSGERSLDELDSFVLREATSLMRLRNNTMCCGTKWHVDHVKAIKNGGLSRHDNLQVVPARWNQSKSYRHENRFFN